MQVPVLDLRPLPAGCARSSRRRQPDQVAAVRGGRTAIEYVFRSADKSSVALPPAYKGTVVETVARDQVSASQPGRRPGRRPPARPRRASSMSPPDLVVMPDDPPLGEFRAEFAGRLGMIEEFPSTPKHGPGFAGAVAIIDSDDTAPAARPRPRRSAIDAPALLAARLMDMLFNDWDRHPGQWKWARMRLEPAQRVAAHRARPGQGVHLVRRRHPRDGPAGGPQPDELRQHLPQRPGADVEQPGVRPPPAGRPGQAGLGFGGGRAGAPDHRLGDRRRGAGPASGIPVVRAAPRPNAQAAARRAAGHVRSVLPVPGRRRRRHPRHRRSRPR